ncbi:MAG: Gfo/Idh/MocA family oxidoreductase, partial [Candidatus Coatesbacteria bacterium]|nr:Gfo/Idh/MocA family oxidoreductase [Candidatus Coatesbacteria bacterium]
MIDIACVGSGAWGKNLVRTFAQVPDARLLYCCDTDPKVLQQLSKAYPGCEATDDYDRVIQDDRVEAVVIASPARLHYEHARAALLAGKHVFVEKPMALASRDADDLIEIAEKGALRLMVGHLLLFHPAVRKLKELISAKDLGEVYYIYSQRTNLGRIRSDESALWSFAPHDISVAIYLLDQEPSSVSADGRAYLQAGVEDVVFLTLHFPDGKMSHIQVSWLDPHKVRRLTVVGSEKMVVFDDVEPMEKLKIYDKGAKLPSYDSYGDS